MIAVPIPQLRGQRIQSEITDDDIITLMNRAVNFGTDAPDEYLDIRDKYDDINVILDHVRALMTQRYELPRAQNVRVQFQLNYTGNTTDGANGGIIAGGSVDSFLEMFKRAIRLMYNRALQCIVNSITMTIITIPTNVQGVNLEKVTKKFKDDKLIIISPKTETQCVSQCLAILEVYRGIKENNLGYDIRKRQTEIARDNKIRDGVNINQMPAICQKFNVEFVTKFDDEQLTPYLFVYDNHCYIALAGDSRAKLIKEQLEIPMEQLQKPMDVFTPKDAKKVTKSTIMTYDFEWVTTDDNGTIFTEPYLWGLGWDDQFKYGSGIINFQKSFLNALHDAVISIDKQKFMLFGFNSFKADFPKILKSLLNDSRFKIVGDTQSGSSYISVTVSVGDKQLIFLDAINFYQGSLKNFLRTYGCEIQKGDVNHSIITSENFEQ